MSLSQRCIEMDIVNRHLRAPDTLRHRILSLFFRSAHGTESNPFVNPITTVVVRSKSNERMLQKPHRGPLTGTNTCVMKFITNDVGTGWCWPVLDGAFVEHNCIRYANQYKRM
jgi:hypothetical protein